MVNIICILHKHYSNSKSSLGTDNSKSSLGTDNNKSSLGTDNSKSLLGTDNSTMNSVLKNHYDFWGKCEAIMIVSM